MHFCTPYLPGCTVLCTIHHKVNIHSLLLMPLSIWQALFCVFSFLCNPISSWSTSWSNRPNVTSFPGYLQIFACRRASLTGVSVSAAEFLHCRFGVTLHGEAFGWALTDSGKKIDGYIFNQFAWLRKTSAFCNSYGSYSHIWQKIFLVRSYMMQNAR